MASPVIRFVQNNSITRIPRLDSSSHKYNLLDSCSNHHHSLSFSNQTQQKRFPTRISVSRFPILSNSSCAQVETFDEIVHEKNERIYDNNELIFSEKLDEWMKDSVVEIVKNLKQAPLLLQVYDNNDGMTKVKTEKAVEENWPKVMKEWKSGGRPSPEGLIFVEELEDGGDHHDSPSPNGGLEEQEDKSCLEEGLTRAWGVVIQGKGVKCAPVCYLLKTSRVRTGMGLFCTHFCLVKVKSFRESALSQLQHCWLLQ